MAARTVRDFQVGGDITQFVDAWAKDDHYGFRGVSPDGTRNYQRGNGLLTGAMPLSIRQNGPQSISRRGSTPTCMPAPAPSS